MKEKFLSVNVSIKLVVLGDGTAETISTTGGSRVVAKHASPEAAVEAIEGFFARMQASFPTAKISGSVS